MTVKQQLKKISLGGLLVLSATLTGCASITEGVHQDVTVLTPPTEGANCRLSNSHGEWYAKGTPASTVVHRGYGDLKVECKKPGYQTKEVTVASSTKGLMFANFIFLDAFFLGMGIDAVDGAGYDYPQTIMVPMEKGRAINHS